MQARRLAASVRQRHSLPPQSGFADLLRLCREIGVSVVVEPELSGPGYYLRGLVAYIAIRDDDPYVLAHEAAHALTEDGEPVIRAYHGRERFCEEFALALVGRRQRR